MKVGTRVRVKVGHWSGKEGLIRFKYVGSISNLTVAKVLFDNNFWTTDVYMSWLEAVNPTVIKLKKFSAWK